MSIAFNGTSSRIAFPLAAFNDERTVPRSVSAMVYFSGAKSGTIKGYSVVSSKKTTGTIAGFEIGLLWTGTILAPNNKLLCYIQIDNNFVANNRISHIGATDLLASTWYTFTATYDGSSTAAGTKLYINGVQETPTVTVNALSASIISDAAANIGARNSAAEWFNGRIANVGIWNVELTAAEVASLAKGVAVDHVRPQSLVLATPMIRDVTDKKGGALTATNTTVADHPRIYL